jgi:hypothetical protein
MNAGFFFRVSSQMRKDSLNTVQPKPKTDAEERQAPSRLENLRIFVAGGLHRVSRDSPHEFRANGIDVSLHVSVTFGLKCIGGAGSGILTCV